MARIRFTVLGCGASPGVPRINGDWGACDPAEPRNRRYRCSALVERFPDDGGPPTRVLIDTGPDLRAQLLKHPVDRIDGVVYTHSHADHTHGIDDLRAYWMIHQARVDVYSDDGTQERLDEGFGYCFKTPPGSPYPPFLERHRIEAGTPVTIVGQGGPLVLLPFRQVHGDIHSLGYRIGNLAYSCDFNDLPDETLPWLDGLDVWIVDALRRRPHPSHCSLDEALAWLQRIGPRQGVLTHMTNELDYATLVAEMPANVVPAHDGLSFEWTTGETAFSIVPS